MDQVLLHPSVPTTGQGLFDATDRGHQRLPMRQRSGGHWLHQGIPRNPPERWIGRRSRTLRQTRDIFSGFDEQAYLNANPDIRDAITAGTVPSGLEHYRRWGRHERRPGAAAVALRAAYQPLDVVPPDALRLRVTNSPDRTSFEALGRIVCDDLLDAMAMFEVHLAAGSRVLDFGCGCGRVLRHLAPQCPGARIEGVDIDSEAIAWCQANFPASLALHRNAEWPPLPFEDAWFDLIYSVSVFTHLPEAMQLAWLAELARVAKPGAWLLLTVHRPDLMPPGNADLTGQMEGTGFAYHLGETTDGLPDFYRTAWHSEAYIHQAWGKMFDVCAVLRGGINNHQDLVVARASGPVSKSGTSA